MTERFRYLIFISLILQFLRFPQIFDRGGMGAFLYIYFLTSIIVGGCLLMGELILGKNAEKTLGSSMVRFLNDRMVLDKAMSPFQQGLLQIGKLLKYVFLAVNFLIVMYLSVISIWLLQAIIGIFYKVDFNVITQSLCAGIHFGFIYFIYKKQNSLHRLENALMFVGMALMGYLFFNSISILKNNSVFLSLFYPDYSQVSWSSLQLALGQTCFSLLLGCGIVTQFGASLDRNRDVTSLATRLVSLSFLSCVFVTIVSMSVMFGKSFSFTGYRYFIETLPKIFTDTLEYASLAALLLSIFYIFVAVFLLRLIRIFRRDMNDSVFRQFPSSKQLFYALYVGSTYLIVFVSSQYKHVKLVGNNSFFDVFEESLITFLFPVYMLLVVVFVYFAAPKKLLRREFSAIEIDQEISHFYPIWRAAVLWLSPLVVAIGLAMYIIDRI